MDKRGSDRARRAGHFRRPALGAAVVAAVMSGLVWDGAAHAATKTWDLQSAGNNNGQINNGGGTWNSGGGGTANWTTNGGTSNTTWSNNDDAIFGGNPGVGAAGTITLSATQQANSLTFNNVPSGNFTLTGQTINFLNTDTSITQNSSSAVTIASAIHGEDTTFTLGGSGTGLVTISGVMDEKNGSHTLALVKTGTSTYLLSGANSFSPVSTIKAGTILIGISDVNGVSGALGVGNVLLGDTTGSNNAALYTNGAFSMNRAITIQSGNTGTISLGGNTANASTFGGNILLGTSGGTSKSATFVALSGGTTDFTGILNENTSVPATGVTIGDASHSGTVRFTNAANAYSGPTTITNGATLEVTKLSNGGTNSSIGNSGSAAAAGSAASDLVFSGATLKYTGTGDSTNRLFTFDNLGGTIDASAAANAALNFTGTGSLVASGSGDRTLTLTGTSTGNNTMTSVIPNPGTGATSLLKSGGGTWVLGGANTYSGSTSVTGGILTANGSLANTSAISVSNGATMNINAAINAATNLTADGTVNFTNVSPTVATLTDSAAGTRSVTLASGLTLTHTGTSAFGGTISGAANLSKTTGGEFTLSGTNTYTGTTSVTGGKLTVNGSITGAGGAVTVSGSGTLAGSGSIARSVNLNSGGTISPANDGSNSTVGTLSTNDQTWAGGSTYTWEIKDTTQAAGTGYDTLNVSGAVNVTATTGNKMTIRIVSHAAVVGFDGVQPWEWDIATGTSNVAGFTGTEQFTLITTDFTDDNPAADPSAFKVSSSGSTIRVTYIPEPTTMVLASVGAMALMRRTRRRV